MKSNLLALLSACGAGTYSVRSMLSTGNAVTSVGAHDQTMPFASDGLCFPTAFRNRTVASVHLRLAGLKDSLSELSESHVIALGRLLPSLLCGEESSFHVF